MKRFALLLLPLALAACSPSSPSNKAPGSAATTAPATTVADTTNNPTTNNPEMTTKSAPEPASSMDVLSHYHWQLVTATDKSGQRIDALFANPDKPLQLDFQHGHIGVSHTCNHMRGSYKINDGTMHIGPMTQTMMACTDDKLMALDKAVGQFLKGDLTATLKQADTSTPRLTLVDAKGNTLVFAGHPTAQTRYGSKGTTVFMEVAAQTVPCDHPPGSSEQCLKVRERHFDANGLKVGQPGQWHPLEQPIQGYTHKDGMRNVLRLKRFKVKDAPAGASSTAYVLDMVVESEATRH